MGPGCWSLASRGLASRFLAASDPNGHHWHQKCRDVCRRRSVSRANRYAALYISMERRMKERKRPNNNRRQQNGRLFFFAHMSALALKTSNSRHDPIGKTLVSVTAAKQRGHVCSTATYFLLFFYKKKRYLVERLPPRTVCRSHPRHREAKKLMEFVTG